VIRKKTFADCTARSPRIWVFTNPAASSLERYTGKSVPRRPRLDLRGGLGEAGSQLMYAISHVTDVQYNSESGGVAQPSVQNMESTQIVGLSFNIFKILILGNIVFTPLNLPHIHRSRTSARCLSHKVEGPKKR
jgi:hypothetical protein